MRNGYLAVLILMSIVVGLYSSPLLPNRVEIESLTTNLYVRPASEPGYDYDASVGQEYYVYVWIENVSLLRYDSVKVALYGAPTDSIEDNLGADTILVLSINPLELKNVSFRVLHMVSLGDSIYARIVYGKDETGLPIGEQIVDNDVMIWVENPANLRLDQFVLDDFVAPNAPFVTEAQPIRFLLRVVNVGEDKIDSVKLRVYRAAGSGSAHSTIVDSILTLRNIYGGAFVDTYVRVIVDSIVNINTGIYELFAVDTIGSWVENTRSSLGSVIYVDNTEQIIIQQPPEIRFPGVPFASGLWLNKTDPLIIGIPVRNRPAPYAPADRFVEPGYPARLYIFPSGGSVPVSGVGGLNAPFDYSSYFYGATDTFYYEIYNIAASYEGIVDIADTIYFHDQNWPAQDYPITSPAFVFQPMLFSIDVTDPQTIIYSPSLSYYNSGTFPETLKVYVTDNLSGVSEVYYTVVDSFGRYWNGTDWDTTYAYLTATYLSGVTWYGMLPILPFGYHGTIRITAWAKDVAGNIEETPSSFFAVIEDIPPMADIFWPDTGYFSDSTWTDKIEIEAIDARSGIKSVRVCILNLNTGLYWDDSYPGQWVSYRKFNNAYHAYGDVWRYNYRPNLDGRYLFYAQVKDSAGNIVEDTLDNPIRYDKTPPISDIDLPIFDYYNASTWIGYILGDAVDPVVGNVHSWVTKVELAIRDTLTNRYWIPPYGWTPARYWFVAQVDTVTSDTFGITQYRYYFTPPAPGHYKAYVRATDWGRLVNPLPADSQLFVYDPVSPIVLPVFPADHGVYNAIYWPDTIRIWAYDSVNTWVSSVQFAVYRTNPPAYWDWPNGNWVGTPVWRNGIPSSGNIWYRRLPAFPDGEYAILVRVRDAAGNLTQRMIFYYISTTGRYLEVVAPAVVMVGEPFSLTVTAYRSPGVIDTFFAEPLGFTANMWTDSIVLPAYPQYLSYGRRTFTITANAAFSGLLITVSGTTVTATSNPIEVIRGVYPPLSYGIYDNPADQGDTLVIHHTLSRNDPYSPFADTATAIVKWYKYYRDINPGPDTNWVIIDSVAPAPRDSVVLKITNNQTFNDYSYSMIVYGETRGGIHNTPISSERIILGTLAPVDNVPPAVPSGFTIERNGDYIRLLWNQVTAGINGLPELKPHENIRYYVYRYTTPYAGVGTFIGVSETTFFDDSNLYGADVVGDTLVNYYWQIYAVDHDGNTSSFTYRVGEIDFVLKEGWSSFGIPFEMFGITNAYQLSSLIPSVATLAKYIPGMGWSSWSAAFPSWNNFLVSVGDGIWAYVPVTDYNYVLTIVGKVPAETSIWYYLRRGNTPWNVVVVPLHFTTLNQASLLCANIPNATSVARWVPRVGSTPGHWEQWVPALPGVNNFPVRPGAAYFVAVSSDGVWPIYVRMKSAPGFGFKSTFVDEDQFMLPAIVYGLLECSGDIDAKLYIEGRKDQVIKGVYQDGALIFQLGDLPGGWRVGDVAVVEISVDGVQIEKRIELTGEPVYRFDSDIKPNIPKEFALKENYPNPFNAATLIRYELPRDSKVELSIYNVVGQLVRTLVDAEIKAGYRSVLWDGTDNMNRLVSSGVYYVRMRAGSYEGSRAILFLK